MISIIQHNPFRIVGVFSTSTRKDIVANLARIKANIRVNRQITFRTDLDSILPSVSRTIESISDAESKLTLPKDVIGNAQFWFVESTEFDKIAINNLAAGSIDKAISIWEKKENLSSVHNRVITYLIKGDYGKALELAYSFYERYSKEFACIILGSESQMVSTAKLAHDFLDTLCNEIGASEVSMYITNQEWGEYIANKIVGPLTESIDRQIAISKESKGKGANLLTSSMRHPNQIM